MQRLLNMKHFRTFAVYGLLSVALVACDPKEGPTPEPVYPDPTWVALTIPKGLPPLPAAFDTVNVEMLDLGRHLFYDPILSGDSTQSCASCHRQEHGFSDPNRFSKGISGAEGVRQSMALINLVYSQHFMWDGRHASLESQAGEPVENPIEMNITWNEALQRLNRHSQYPDRFGKAFGTRTATRERATAAIAQFIRTLISGKSKFDLAQQNGSGVFFTEEELRGKEVFNTEVGNCYHCHGGVLATNNNFGNNGLDAVGDFFGFADKGLGNFTKDANDNGMFRIPTLRNIEMTAPYMHDGRFATLEEVINHYSEGIQSSPTLHPIIGSESPGGVHMNEADKAALLACLKTFTDTSFLNNPNYASPF